MQEQISRQIVTALSLKITETGHRDACESPTPLKKSRRAARSRTSDFPQARPLPPLVVPARADQTPALAWTRSSAAVLRSACSAGHLSLRLNVSGGEQAAQQSQIWPALFLEYGASAP